MGELFFNLLSDIFYLVTKNWQDFWLQFPFLLQSSIFTYFIYIYLNCIATLLNKLYDRPSQIIKRPFGHLNYLGIIFVNWLTLCCQIFFILWRKKLAGLQFLLQMVFNILLLNKLCNRLCLLTIKFIWIALKALFDFFGLTSGMLGWSYLEFAACFLLFHSFPVQTPAFLASP